MDRFDRPRKTLAICLAGLAGYVDAIGFLSADRYFVSFMSGNTTRLGADIAQGESAAMVPALLIGGFVCGVALGSVIANLAGKWRKPALLAGITGLLLIAAIVAGAFPGRTMLYVLVLAMGAINNTFQRGETPIGLTYMTGALVRIGQGIGSWITGNPRTGTGAFLLLWAGLAGGALAGALAFTRIGSGSLWWAAGAAGFLTLAGWWLARNAPPPDNAS